MKIFIKQWVSILITITFICNIIIPKITYSFRFIITFFFLFKKCSDVSNYSILNYSSIFLLFFLSSFSSSASKSVQISLIVLSCNLSLIIFGFFPITFCLINQSNQFLLIGFIFFISCSSNLLNRSSVFLLIFYSLCFNSISFDSIKYFSEIYSKTFCSSNFHSYICIKIFWKIYENNSTYF